jgi:CRISPR system Cascade subunit CasA
MVNATSTSQAPSTFNLIDQPWIQVQCLDGQVVELSLVDVFARAHELRAITGELPTQSFSLLRLLLAILECGVSGPSDVARWRELWEADALPAGDIGEYLDQHRDRFDLLHAETPFYQVADLSTKKDEPRGLQALLADVPAGHQFFTTRAGTGLEAISYAEAARWLVHVQAFDVSGIKPGAEDDDRVKGGKGYPIGTGFAGTLGGVFVDGDTLKQTLLLNVIPHDSTVVKRSADDKPVWERDRHKSGVEARLEQCPKGTLDLYSWQSRRVRLIGDGDKITGALVCNGDKLTAHNLQHYEPMTAWRRSQAQEKLRREPTVYLPRQHDPSRAVWRGLASILPGTAGRGKAGEPASALDPLLLEWISELVEHGVLSAETKVRLRVTGAVYGTQQSVIDEIVDDSLSMNVGVLSRGSPQLATTVTDAVADAEAAVWALAGLATDLAKAAGNRDSVDGARDRAAEAGYAALDSAFRTWLASLHPHTEPLAARTGWQRQVHIDMVKQASFLVDSAPPSSWIGREVNGHFLTSPQADSIFRRRLRKALPLAYPSAIGAKEPVTT